MCRFLPLNRGPKSGEELLLLFLLLPMLCPCRSPSKRSIDLHIEDFGLVFQPYRLHVMKECTSRNWLRRVVKHPTYVHTNTNYYNQKGERGELFLPNIRILYYNETQNNNHTVRKALFSRQPLYWANIFAAGLPTQGDAFYSVLAPMSFPQN